MRTLLLSALIIACTAFCPNANADSPVDLSTTLSYTRTAGNTDSHSIGWSGGISYSFSRFIISGGGNYVVAPGADGKTAESVSANGGVEIYIVPKKLYVLYEAIYGRNTFAGLEHKISNLGGLGVTIVKTDSHSWSASTGAKYVYESYPENIGLAESNDKFTAVNVGTEYALTPRDYLEFAAELSYDINLENTEDQGLGVTGAADVTITPWLAFAVSETLSFDNVPVTGFEKYDYTTNIGFTLQYE